MNARVLGCGLFVLGTLFLLGFTIYRMGVAMHLIGG